MAKNNKSNSQTPRTIKQLRSWYEARNLPSPYITRFFIGEDVQEPKAFGIYRDNSGNYVVYKNKADGTRAIRYRGRDEARAINEIYLKLKQEIANRKFSSKYDEVTDSQVQVVTDGFKLLLGVFLLILALLISVRGCIRLVTYKGSRGYYKTKDALYYRYNTSNWYIYDALLDTWEYLEYNSLPVDVRTNSDEYYQGEDWSQEIGAPNFEDTEYYESLAESEHDSNSYYSDDDSDYDWSGDSDYNWDSGDSWDSGDTNWDTDW